MKPMSIAAAVWIVFLSAGSAIAQEWTPQREQRLESKPQYSPYVDSHYPQRVYWGKRFGIEMAEEVRMTIQDRAYTSPIWYTP